ncbi:TIGR00282 family metallophosphoesterase [Pseudalkalibacillus berkeleyi]|uniref:TIGR00282 family metallophosphoesterase n=1 Tax=Pseudalkalibacillus berkeleyi TaxID=1069813 RepID=A0ABS9H074_9BACL|nr:TIGR00282 family metallophosphoesterase [Pseudalkalibacillus berkeleyi]MCF6137182.1 TIGR00282 family metallophosphoesterase [Pseudalkalibacillus berkeleyi]
MRILFVGDVVGSPGRSMVETYLSKLKSKYKPTLTIVNGENAAHGRGITEKITRNLKQWGAQAITMGNHTWDNKEIFEFIDDVPQMVRPANFPEGTPGQGYTFVKINNVEVAIINLQGRTFMPPLDCPFQKADEIIEKVRSRTPYIFVDFHAEATSEKQAMGWYLDGRVSAVVGTHTHVQTSDNRVLTGGTAYISDVGMTGPYDGILGMSKEAVLKKFLTNLPVRFEVENGREQLSGVVIDLHKETGLAKSIKRIQINEDHPFHD